MRRKPYILNQVCALHISPDRDINEFHPKQRKVSVSTAQISESVNHGEVPTRSIKMMPLSDDVTEAIVIIAFPLKMGLEDHVEEEFLLLLGS
jgi:hypothetical protein